MSAHFARSRMADKPCATVRIGEGLSRVAYDHVHYMITRPLLREA